MRPNERLERMDGTEKPVEIGGFTFCHGTPQSWDWETTGTGLFRRLRAMPLLQMIDAERRLS